MKELTFLSSLLSSMTCGAVKYAQAIAQKIRSDLCTGEVENKRRIDAGVEEIKIVFIKKASRQRRAINEEINECK